MTSTPAQHPTRPSTDDTPTLPLSTAAPAPPTAPTPVRPRIDLTVAQVGGSALAAATASVAASSLGVAGTIIGAVVGSLIATVGGAIYVHSLRRAGHRIRRTLPISGIPARPSIPGPEPTPVGRFRLVAGLAMGVILALGGITAYESLLGHPISNATGSGTTLSTAAQEITGTPVGGTSPAAPATTPTAPATPSTKSTPSPTQSPSGSPSPTPSSTPTPSPTPTTSPTELAPAPTTGTPSPTEPAPSAPATGTGESGPAGANSAVSP